MKNQQETANNRKQTIILLLGIIVCAGIFGWVYETLFYLYNFDGLLVKRGNNFGPWINIYSLGGVLIYFSCRKLAHTPWCVFLISGTVCGLLEYIAGYAMDHIYHGDWGWNYNTEKLNFGNINGYVCLRSVLVFALGGCLLFHTLATPSRW